MSQKICTHKMAMNQGWFTGTDQNTDATQVPVYYVCIPSSNF